MATISKNKGNGKIKMMVTEQEFNTLTIALALLNIPDMEVEMKEQGLTDNQVSFKHLEMFDSFTKVNKLYPQQTGEEVSE